MYIHIHTTIINEKRHGFEREKWQDINEKRRGFEREQWQDRYKGDLCGEKRIRD